MQITNLCEQDKSQGVYKQTKENKVKQDQTTKYL